LVLDPSFLRAVNTSIIPASDFSHDLGSPTYRWRYGYFAGSVTVASLYVGNTNVIDTYRNLLNIASLTFASRTDDPTLVAGRLWFRSDLRQLRWSPDGTAVKQVYPADWGDITNKPSTFPPSPHTHPRGDITDFWSSPFWNNIPDKPSTFPPSAHASSHKPGGSDPLFPADYSLLPSSDNTYDLGSPTYRWRNLYLAGSLTVPTANVSTLQVGGITVIDSSRNLRNVVSVQSDHLSPGAVFLLAEPVDADSTNTLRSSPDIVLRGKYWTEFGSADFDASIRHVMTGGAILSKLSFMFGGSEKAYIDSSGNVNVASLLVGGTTVIGSDRSLRNIVGVAQSLLPSSDNTYDLGSSTYRWRNAYLSGSLTVAGTANVGSLQIAGTTVITSGRVLQNIASIGQTLTPSADNTYDLGSSSYRWRNLYLGGALVVAGAANVGSLQIGGTTVIDSSRNVINAMSVTSTTLSPGTDFLIAQPYDASSAITLRNSPDIVLRGKYWTGTSSATYDAEIRHVMTSTVPSSKLSFMFGGVEMAFIASDGSMNIGSLLVGGTTVIDSFRNLQNVNWISGVMRRDTGQEIFRCQNNDSQTFYFALRNAGDTGARDHRFAPLNDFFGGWGTSSNRWYNLISIIMHTWELDFRGPTSSYLPLDPNTHHSLTPYTDGYSFIGTATERFYYIRGLYVVSGDIGFEDRRCLVCGREFKEGDAVVLKVRKVDEENMQVLAVPVHAECNPHPLDPELLREHEKLLTPNRSGVRHELNPPGPGEFEVVSVTVEDENTMMVNVVYGDGKALSFPAPVDADEETITKLANEYYNIVKGREADREAKIARGRAKLKREWRGYKGKIAIREGDLTKR
jgi:hypothetical protein